MMSEHGARTLEAVRLIEKLRRLGACQSGCNGRCQECPDDVASQAADMIAALAAAGDRTAVPHDPGDVPDSAFAYLDNAAVPHDQREPESTQDARHDQLALEVARQIEGIIAQEHKGGPVQRQSRIQTAVTDALFRGSPGKGEGWREIESAPKDETPIQLGRAGHIPMTGYCGRNVPFDPTHWQPLPSPPISSE